MRSGEAALSVPSSSPEVGSSGPMGPVDVLVALVTAGVAVAGLALSDDPGAREVDPLAHVLLVVSAAPLLWRRRRPVAVLVATSAVALAYLSLDYPGGPPTLIVLVALYAVASAGHRRWAWAVTGMFAVVGTLFRAVIEGDQLVAVALNAALFVLAALLGEAVFGRRALAAAARHRLEVAEQEHEREMRRRMAEERLRIARDLHDVMAHTVTTMSVQAGAAADLLDERPDQAEAVLYDLRRSAGEAMRELQATVSVLRAGGAEESGREPVSGLERLDAVIEDVRKAGLRVEHRRSGVVRALPAPVEITALRIVQEALTNVVRHADAATATVMIRYEPEGLIVEVEDDGRGPGQDMREGFGLVGLHERVQAVGGRLHTGVAPGGGFRVRAHLPDDPEHR